MSNQLVKADAARKRNKLNPNSLLGSLANGGPVVWFSCIFMGFGNLVAGQFIKGLMFLAIELGIIYFMCMPRGGFFDISQLGGLGDKDNIEVWNEDIMGYEYIQFTESWKLLLFGILAILVIGLFIFMWQVSIRSGHLALIERRTKKRVNNFWQDIKDLFDKNLHKLLMSLPFACLLIFTILPLIYMISMAFTNYGRISGGADNTYMFDWVGLDVFKSFFQSSSKIGEQFWDVLAWTLVWAFFATFLNFFFGTFVAMMINRPTTKAKGLWRTIFSITIAVPQFVSLLIVQAMFDNNGVINNILKEWNFISKPIPFLNDLTNPNTTRAFVIIVNLWVGIPYTIMQVTGILKNIPGDLYEAARIDGANVVQQFMNITLPYMIFVMTPYIITSFTGNINNFNVIFLLSNGAPTQLGNTAGDTDLLVTWLYKMSMNNKRFNVAAVIGIFTFVILAVVSLVTYRSTGSYKDEEGFK